VVLVADALFVAAEDIDAAALFAILGPGVGVGEGESWIAPAGWRSAFLAVV
jgi:hypothetical protein